jgi:hypothetical protein
MVPTTEIRAGDEAAEDRIQPLQNMFEVPITEISAKIVWDFADEGQVNAGWKWETISSIHRHEFLHFRFEDVRVRNKIEKIRRKDQAIYFQELL